MQFSMTESKCSWKFVETSEDKLLFTEGLIERCYLPFVDPFLNQHASVHLLVNSQFILFELLAFRWTVALSPLVQLYFLETALILSAVP